jgi:ABC-2 type transport system ATP-binding protein
MSAIVADKLARRFAQTQALEQFDLDVPPGTVCGLLGPNGAGKTTAVRILTTLQRADGGRAQVAGFDVARAPAQVRRQIGLVGQHAAVDEILTGRQNLVMFGRLYHLGRAAAAARADELLVQFGLDDTGSKSVKDYSGGMRRRLDLAAGLILAPRVLFLDEPTAGLDPRSRNEVWRAVRGLVAAGTTVLLTTQYLEEADQLADSICMLERGRVIARGTPDELKARIGRDRLAVVVHRDDDLERTAGIVQQVAAAEALIEPDARRVSVPVEDRVAALSQVVRALHDAGIDAEDIALRRPTLDEVFLHLTEHQAVAA